ncbi:MAG: NAD-dependent deacylase [Bacteroidales bacterium]|jgi:NAD-dependent deacetylase|nr:NAD-dependent deacylase [Bacteroidales bacterium]
MQKGSAKIVILTGAGISAESGISTFRDSDGLWCNHKIEDVCTPMAWAKNPQLVTDFYNARRKQLFEVVPNNAHTKLAELEKKYDVTVITQNVDDLHERGGSSNVLHLHGELKKVRSTVNSNLIYELKHWEVKIGDMCELGSQLRPHIVWFGEDVPNFNLAMEISQQADIFIVIGTSLQVYPAASLLYLINNNVPKYLIDPNAENYQNIENLYIIREKATVGVEKLVSKLMRFDKFTN